MYKVSGDSNKKLFLQLLLEQTVTSRVKLATFFQMSLYVITHHKIFSFDIVRIINVLIRFNMKKKSGH